MRFSSASIVVTVFVLAMSFVDVARAADIPCVRACKVVQAKEFDRVVKTYPNHKDEQRLRALVWATVERGHCESDCYDS